MKMPPPARVEMVKQRGTHDCGVAAAAMALRIPYEVALARLRDPGVLVEEFEGQTRAGIIPEELSWLAFKLHAACCVVTINEAQPHDHWAYVWRDVFRRATLEDLDDLLWTDTGVTGILGVDSLNSPGEAHWVVVENGVVYDPSTRKVYKPGVVLPIHVAILIRFGW